MATVSPWDWRHNKRPRQYAISSIACAALLGTLFFYKSSNPSSSDTIRRKLAEEDRLDDFGNQSYKANATGTPPAPVTGLRIANGGEIWPVFTPDTANYRITLPPHVHDDHLGVTAPEVELEIRLNEQSLDHRLFVNGVEVQQVLGPRSDTDGSSSPQLRRHRLVLGHLARRNTDGTPLYPYEAVELEVRAPVAATFGSAAVVPLRRQYWLRFFQPSRKRGEGAAASSEAAQDRRLIHADAGEAGIIQNFGATSSSHAPSGQYAILDLHYTRVALELTHGSCRLVQGPLEGERKQAPQYAKELGLWSSKTKHVFCFAPEHSEQNRGGVDEDDDVHFVAWGMQEDRGVGKFGFGDGVNVSLRPKIETDAKWPLESGVRSVSLKLTTDEVFMVAAVLGEVRGEDEKSNVPLVTARSRGSRPVEVQFLNESLGHCSLEDIGAVQLVVVCRTAKDVPDGDAIELLALCGSCIESGNEHWKMQVEDQGRYPVPAAAPWVAWSGTAPKQDHTFSWQVALQGNSEGEPVQVYLVHGDDNIDWMAEEQAKAEVRTAGDTLRFLVWLLIVTTSIMGILATVGMQPVPVVAVLPSVTSAITAVQFMTLVGSRSDAPVLLRGLCEPLAFFLPVSTMGQLRQSLGVLLICVLGHLFVAGKHLVVNGSGSAQSLPHGLQAGSWELRFLGLVALPLSAASCRLIADGYNSVSALYESSDYHGVSQTLGLAVLAGMLYCAVLLIGNVTWVRISTWVTDERVIGMVLPAARDGFIFVDRVCSQLRTMPVSYGRTKLLGSWSTTPGWCVAGPVASIQEMEHAGTSAREEKKQAWEQVWPSGPWSKDAGRDMGAMGVSRNPSLPSGMMRSPVRSVHHVKASTTFVYKGCRKNFIAGITALTWLDVAVPASDLKTLESQLGSVPLRAHPGQLSGPLTDGRLAACFDWGTRWPWRWPVDLLVKAALGAYLAFDLSVPKWLRFSVAMGLTCLAAAVWMKRPYVHIFDNTALAGAIVTATAVDILRFLSDDASFFRENILALAMVASIPLGIALCATILASCMAVQCQVMDMQKHILPRCVVGWVKAEEKQAQRPGGYEGATVVDNGPVQKKKSVRFKEYGILVSEEEDDKLCGPTQEDQDDAVGRGPGAGFRKVNVRVTLSTGTSPMNLPAKALMAISRARVQKPHAEGEAVTHLPETAELPTVPLTVSHLFTDSAVQPNVGANPSTESVFSSFGVETTPPLAVLLTPDGGRLIYSDAKDNLGIRWQDASRSFFGPEEENLALEIEQIINTYSLMRDETPMESSIVVIEILDG